VNYDQVLEFIAPLPPAQKLALALLGAGYASAAVLEQLNVTLKADAQHGHLLRTRGFRAAAAAHTAKVQEALRVALAHQATVGPDDKATNGELVVAMKSGKRVRLEARSVLGEVLDELLLVDTAAAGEAARAIEAGLAANATAGADPEKLATQLEALTVLLDHPEVKAVLEVAEVAAAAQARAAATALRVADAKSRRRAGEVQQVLDILDGLGIRRARAARKAARAASRELGDPLIAAAFELSTLYGR
jgi:hypothetical protein